MFIMTDKSHSDIFYILCICCCYILHNQEIVQHRSNNNFLVYQFDLIKNILLALEIKYLETLRTLTFLIDYISN